MTYLHTDIYVVYTVLHSTAHLVIIVNKSYFNQINIYITYLLQLFLEVFELTQLTGQTGGQTCDIYICILYKVYYKHKKNPGRYLSPESHVSRDVEPEIYGNRNTIGNIYGNGRIDC